MDVSSLRFQKHGAPKIGASRSINIRILQSASKALDAKVCRILFGLCGLLGRYKTLRPALLLRFRVVAAVASVRAMIGGRGSVRVPNSNSPIC